MGEIAEIVLIFQLFIEKPSKYMVIKNLKKNIMDKKALRPVIKTIDYEQSMNPFEQFQNTVLRPILKLQNDLIMSLFANHTANRNKGFEAMAVQQKVAWIESLLQKDAAFRNQIIGIVFGLLEVEELYVYFSSKLELNRRIIQMTQQRIKDNLELNPS